MKKLICLLLFCSLFLSFIPAFAEEPETVYGKVYAASLTQYYDDVVLVSFAKSSGETESLECARKIKINGTIYTSDEPQSILSAIPENVCAKFTLNADEYISSIDFSSNGTFHKGISYNLNANSFDGILATDLPIYYEINEKMYPAYLDENHLYDITLYEYGIIIEDFYAKNESFVTLKYIDIGDPVKGDFSRSINVLYESNDNINKTMVVTLNDKSGNFISNKSCKDYGNEMYQVDFGGVPNETKEYMLKIYFEDSNGNKISNEYTYNYRVEEKEILYGYIYRTYSFGGDLSVQIEHNNRKSPSYDFKERVIVNNEMIKDIATLEGKIVTGSYAKFALDDRKITTIAFSDSYASYDKVTFDAVSKKFNINKNTEGLPVYYRDHLEYISTKEQFLTPFLDDNHFYNIKVYEYGIEIADYYAKNESYETIKTLAPYSEVYSSNRSIFNIFHSICLPGSSTIEGNPDYIYKIELYDKNNNFIELKTVSAKDHTDGIITPDSLINVFYGLPNIDEVYTIKLKIETTEGKPASCIYETTVETEYYPIYKGQIIEVDYDRCAIKDEDGFIREYNYKPHYTADFKAGQYIAYAEHWSTLKAYATCEAYPYITTFKYNYDNDKTLSTISPEGLSIVLPNDIPKNPGYEFTGWYDNKECEGEPYIAPGGTKTANEDITLYAGWKIIEAISGNIEKKDAGYSLNISVDTDKLSLQKTTKILTALYDKYGKFITMKQIEVDELSSGNTSVDIETGEEATSAKTFIWSGFSELVPLCKDNEIKTE